MAARPDLNYSDEAIAEIKAHVLIEVASGRSVARILREDDGMPARSQFWRWTFQDEDYQITLARARDHGVEASLDEVEDIADAADDDAEIIWRDGVAVGAKVNGTAIRRAHLQIETRIKRAQLLAPRRYGNKLDLTSAGEKIEHSPILNDNRLQAIVGVVGRRKLKALEAPQENDDADPLA